MIVVSSAKDAEECFTKNDIVFANRPKSLSGKHISYNYTTILTAPYGDHWRNLRRITATELLSSKRVNMSVAIRREEIKRLLKKLSTYNSRQEFKKVELKTMFSELTFNITMRMIAGKRYYGDNVEDEEEARRFRDTVKEVLAVNETSNPGDFLPFLNWIGDFEKRILRLSKTMDTILQGLVDQHRNKKAGLESMDTMIDHMLSLQESQPQYYTDQNIKALMLTLIIAGIDTSAITLEWAMANLVNHPEVLKNARAELNAQVGQECLIDESDLSKLPYLRNIVSETLRLNPAAPLLIPHRSSDDCTVGGYDVPRDTTLLVNAWAIHRDPELWDEPTCFKPERFESSESEAHKLMPFGLGRRACPGASLAQRLVGSTLGSLLQCFEWKRIGEDKIDMTEGRGITMPKAVALQVMRKACPNIHKILFDSDKKI
ncbi:hypothetical protein CUMW_125160 [Citrus unshiu]|nr:hypothetical protein CUMW_125160 [Citrus unshiu]